MPQYDTALKAVLQAMGGVALRELTSYAVNAWHNVELSNPQTLRVDLLGETSEGGLLHVELQSSNDTRMALRMFEYCLGVYRQHGRFPEQVVLYVGEAPLNMPEGLEGPGVSFRYRLMDVRQFDGGGLLESEFIEDNIVAVLAGGHGQIETIRRILRRIAATDPGKRVRAVGLLMTLAGLRKAATIVEAEIKRMPILDDILEHEVLGREYKKGRQEGRQEGLQEGELHILRLLIEKRFGPIPAWAEERLQKQTAGALERLSLRLLEARTLKGLLG